MKKQKGMAWRRLHTLLAVLAAPLLLTAAGYPSRAVKRAGAGAEHCRDYPRVVAGDVGGDR